MTAGKTLSGRIFATLFTLSCVVMLAATVAAMAATYSSYEADAESALMSQAQQCASSLNTQADTNAMKAALAEVPLADVRSTLIDKDGTVLFDNQVDASQLENHGDRAEVVQARESGTGVVMRRSETLGTDTLYAAVEVRDGIVVRLAQTRASLASFLSGSAWQLGISLLVIFALSFLLSRLLTNMVVRPLRDVDLARPLENDAYAEVQPLLARVDEQRRELEAQNTELRHAVTLRREFTGNVSHEMKTPLQVIGGYAELMQAGVVPTEEVPQFAGLIRSEAEQMRTLVDDVLMLSRLDEGAAAGAAEKILLQEVCQRVMERLEKSAAGRDISFQFDGNDALVMGAPSTAEQMVYNLVDNAVKYSPNGGTVRLSLSCENDQVKFCVSDEGPGIPDEDKERVFERFYRVDASRSRETGGTGLGLAIVKHAAESMGGTVHVEDAPNGGSLFIVQIPAV